jgi:transcription elongation factor SPT5
MLPVTGTSVPSITHVGNYFFDYAALLLEVHNTMVSHLDSAADEPTKYATILRFDGELRALCVEKVPKCLNPRTPYDPGWPKWVGWARKLHQASVNHKLIMIHQNFLSQSFKDVRYTYSRWACATAAKNIINMYGTRDPEEPQWWVEQAFVVTAGICLVLDLFHRAEGDSETLEYQACVQKAIRFLQLFITSSVAVHGVRLLMSLLQEYDKLKEGATSRTAPPPTTTPARACSCVAAGNIADIAIPDITNAVHELVSEPDAPLLFDDGTMFNFDIDALGFETLMDYLPSEGSLNNNVFFDSMLSANNLDQLSANGWPTW